MTAVSEQWLSIFYHDPVAPAGYIVAGKRGLEVTTVDID